MAAPTWRSGTSSPSTICRGAPLLSPDLPLVTSLGTTAISSWPLSQTDTFSRTYSPGHIVDPVDISRATQSQRLPPSPDTPHPTHRATTSSYHLCFPTKHPPVLKSLLFTNTIHIFCASLPLLVINCPHFPNKLLLLHNDPRHAPLWLSLAPYGFPSHLHRVIATQNASPSAEDSRSIISFHPRSNPKSQELTIPILEEETEEMG